MLAALTPQADVLATAGEVFTLSPMRPLTPPQLALRRAVTRRGKLVVDGNRAAVAADQVAKLQMGRYSHERQGIGAIVQLGKGRPHQIAPTCSSSCIVELFLSVHAGAEE